MDSSAAATTNNSCLGTAVKASFDLAAVGADLDHVTVVGALIAGDSGVVFCLPDSFSYPFLDEIEADEWHKKPQNDR